MQDDTNQPNNLTQPQPNTKMELGTLYSKDGESATEGRQSLSINDILNSLRRSIKNEVKPENISHIVDLLEGKLKELGVLQ